MTWTIDEVVNALQNQNYPELESDKDLALQLFDSRNIYGIGVDSRGRRVLVLPGQEKSSSFITKNAEFDHWSSVKWIDTDQNLPNVSTLRCEANFKNKSICEAVAAIFIGLIKIQSRYGSAGPAIWEMKLLFENGFNSSITEEALVGLFGELVLIKSSQDPNVLVQHWHSNTDAYFDFSSENQRIEVKTSKSNIRNHKFSSNQIGNEFDDKTLVVSTVLNLVEQGTGISELIQDISTKLSAENATKLLNIVVSTLGTLPELVDGFNVDLGTTINSIRYIKAINIPRPQRSPGVISMNWIANLDDVQYEKMDPSVLLH